MAAKNPIRRFAGNPSDVARAKERAELKRASRVAVEDADEGVSDEEKAWEAEQAARRREAEEIEDSNSDDDSYFSDDGRFLGTAAVSFNHRSMA